MTVHFIGAGPGAADLITLRGRDLIGRCPVCLYAGSIIPRDLLQHCPSGARIIDTAPLSLDQIEAEFVAACRRQVAEGARSEGLLAFMAGYRRVDQADRFVLISTWQSAEDAARVTGADDAHPRSETILADVALGYLVWSMTLELGGSRRAARLGAAVVVFNPITWFDSAIWGQVDSVGVVVLLFAIRELWRDLREVGAQTRPDWDLSRPGLREAWQAGDWSSFHGWDRRAPEAMPARL